MRAHHVARLFVISMVTLIVSGRTLKQASPPMVTGAQLTEAIQEINKFAQVPDTSAAVAKSPAYYNMVAALQGPAAAIVRAADILNAPAQAPTADAYFDYVNALRAYGYQSGKSALGPAGQALYSAYEAITNFLGFTS